MIVSGLLDPLIVFVGTSPDLPWQQHIPYGYVI
jgi:hypothetical protein